MSAGRSAAMGIREPVRELSRVHGPVAAALLLFSAACFPLAPTLLPVSAVGGFIALAWHHRHDRERVLADRWSSPLPYAIALYLWHIVGMAWSTDFDFGLFDLGIKAPLLVLPTLTLWVGRKWWRGREPLLLVFSIANIVAVMVCIAAAVIRIVRNGGADAGQQVFSSRWSLFLHPSYFAMYLITGLVAWCLLPLPRTWPTWLFRLGLVVLCVGVVLCGSKVGWLLLLLLLPALLVLRWSDRRLRRSLVGMMGITLIGLVVLVLSSRYALDRVQEVWRAATERDHDAKAQTSSEVRWLTWDSAWRLFTERPLLGTGTGDIKDELVRDYIAHAYSTAAEHRLNAHDQFLQTAACLGIPGASLILAMFFVPLLARGRRDALMTIFLLICAVNWMVESMLEVQAGAVFFAYFACVLLWSGEMPPSSPPSNRRPAIT